MIRVVELSGDPVARGTAHGAAYPADLRAYTEERVRLVTGGSWSGQEAAHAEIMALATDMLPVHADYSPSLYQEMLAMADAGGLTPEEALIVGGFTDFVDAVRGRFGPAPEEDTCTAVLVPEPAAAGPGLLGQTWDMHDTATEHIVLLNLRADDVPDAFVFTTVGCLGQIGLNDAGIAIGINNLVSAGRAGVTWPFVVRKALEQTTLEAAVDAVISAPLAGAHNYLLMDATGRGFNIEAMPTATSVTEVSSEPYVHTNHCLDVETIAYEAPKPVDLMASSVARLDTARALLANGPMDEKSLMDLTRESSAICQVPTPPFNIESCGAAIMRPATLDFWAVWGRPDLHEYEHFTLRRARG